MTCLVGFVTLIALWLNLAGAVGHSFRFREGLSELQAEDAESAQAVLDAEREFLINDATVRDRDRIDFAAF